MTVGVLIILFVLSLLTPRPEELNAVNPQMAPPVRHPPHEASLLARLVCLASDIFDHTVAHPPAAHYREIVFNTKQLLFQPKPSASTSPQTKGHSGGGLEDIFATIMHDGASANFQA